VGRAPLAVLKRRITMEKQNLTLELGVKSDPIVYRYSFDWLFDLMQEEGVGYLQLGSFFELYFLSDEFFHALREKANRRNIRIASIFSSYRELGGFLSEDTELQRVTGNNYRRLIQIARTLGASSAGASMGMVLRDHLHRRARSIETFIGYYCELMHYAREAGLEWLTLELMSCYAEPPCSSDEARRLGGTLSEYHHAHPESTVNFGFCADISHGWANEKKEIVQDNISYFISSLPFIYEFHLKNTDGVFHDTFGFEPANIPRGIVDAAQVRTILLDNHALLPVSKIIGYLELPGPKLGRDYTDIQLGRMLRESLRHLKKTFLNLNV
jgi:hypothetical protein